MTILRTIALAAALALGTAASAQEQLKLATIAPGTSAYLTMTTFANIINQNQSDYSITVDATGVATKHGIEMTEGKLDFAMTSPTVYNWLKTGTAMYQEVPNHAEIAEKQRLLMWFPLGEYHIVVHADSDIRTMADLRGRKVFLGPPGGGAWTASYGFVKAVTGLDANEGDYEAVNASWSSALAGFQDRQFDVYINIGIAPFPVVEQLALTGEIRLIGMTREEYEANTAVQELWASQDGNDVGVIPAGIYGPNVESNGDVYTLSSEVGIMTRADMAEDQVYTLMKTFWDNLEAARSTTPWLEEITLDYAVHEAGMKLHPGAARYYQEIGVSIPEGSLP
jgi:TRAP transporter TAXI family solute receptor